MGHWPVCMIVMLYQLQPLQWLLSVEELPDLCKIVAVCHCQKPTIDVLIKRTPCLDGKNFFGTPYLERHFLIEVALTPSTWQTCTRTFHVSLDGLLNASAPKEFVLQHTEL